MAIALGGLPLSSCPTFAGPGGTVSIGRLIEAVANALEGCQGQRRTPTPTPRTGTFSLTVRSGGLDRRVLVTVPDGLGPGAAPLLLFFHGILETPEILTAASGMIDEALRERFILAVPEGFQRSWNAGICCGGAFENGIDDVAFAHAVVDEISATYSIDPMRVYASGFSNGAAMAFRLGCEASQEFAAIAGVGGPLFTLPCLPNRPVPLLMINGVHDPIVLFVPQALVSFGLWREANSCGPDVVTTQVTASTVCDSVTMCAMNVPTILCAVSGIGHVWPGGTADPFGLFDATIAVWDFLSRHRR